MRDRIIEDLKNAMKSKDKTRLSVIRMVKASMQLEELNLKRNLNDSEVITIIAKQIKTRKESIEEFKKGGRLDLVEDTEKEIAILEEYLPEQLSKEEAEKIIENAFKEINPTSMKDMGKIMKTITPKISGRYDMSEISKIVKEKLQ